MAEESEAGFVFTIDGTEYPLKGEMTMEEASIVYDYSGIALDQLDEVEGFNPQVWSGYMHVAVKRAESGMTDKQIRQKIGKVSAVEILTAIVEFLESRKEQEDDAGPPDETPAETAGNGESESSSGPDSENGSENPPEDIDRSGTGPHRSEITAISDRRVSAV